MSLAPRLHTFAIGAFASFATATANHTWAWMEEQPAVQTALRTARARQEAVLAAAAGLEEEEDQKQFLREHKLVVVRGAHRETVSARA